MAEKLPLGVHEGDVVDDAWHLFTPDFAYAKAPYDVRTHEGGELVRCYPNAGVMCSMDGSGRQFEACECEVRYVGWEREMREMGARTPTPVAEPEPTRSVRQATARELRKDRIEARKHPPGTWWVRPE
jgi:hypothetical protein